MVILDTNVVSEMMRLTPDAVVSQWVSGQDPIDLYTTTISEAEMRYGAEILPPGRRRQTLMEVIENILRSKFTDRVLPFDRSAAQSYAMVAAARRAAGRPIDHADCQIAAIAFSTGAAVATRDIGGFQDCGVEIINPWAAQ